MSVTVVADAAGHNVSCDTPVHAGRVNRSGCECTVMTDVALQNLNCDTPVHYRGVNRSDCARSDCDSVSVLCTMVADATSCDTPVH